jgi:hypothetical protein
MAPSSAESSFPAGAAILRSAAPVRTAERSEPAAWATPLFSEEPWARLTLSSGAGWEPFASVPTPLLKTPHELATVATVTSPTQTRAPRRAGPGALFRLAPAAMAVSGLAVTHFQALQGALFSRPWQSLPLPQPPKPRSARGATESALSARPMTLNEPKATPVSCSLLP